MFNPKIVVSGPLFNHTVSSIYCALCLCLAPPWYVAILCISGLLAYSSTMSILAAIVGVVHFYLENKNKFYYWFYPLGGICLYVLHGTNEFFSGQERLAVWKNIIKEFPLPGGGLGYFHDFYTNTAGSYHLYIFKEYDTLMPKHTQIFIQEHNEYLAAFTTFGVAGLVAAIGAVILVIIQKPSRQKSATLAFLFLCVGSFPLHVSSIAIIGIMLYTLTIQRSELWLFHQRN